MEKDIYSLNEDVRVRERLQHQFTTLTDMAISSVFEDSVDIRQALAEAFED
jgi:hypothetical protein